MADGGQRGHEAEAESAVGAIRRKVVAKGAADRADHPPGVRMPLAIDPLVRRLAGDESLTRQLGDIEGRMLVEWLVEWAEFLGSSVTSEVYGQRLLDSLSRRGRAIARFVTLWNEPGSRSAAVQLAEVERFAWPLPTGQIKSTELMEHVLNWERVGRTQENSNSD